MTFQGQPELYGSSHLLQSCFSFSSVSMANLSHLVATISNLAFLSSSVSMVKLSRLVAASFCSLALLSSSISMANLSCLLATTISSLSFLSNSFASPHFNLLRVVRRCFSWSSLSDDLFISSYRFFVLLLALSFSRLILTLSFPCSSVSEALFALSFSFLSERMFLAMVFSVQVSTFL